MNASIEDVSRPYCPEMATTSMPNFCACGSGACRPEGRCTDIVSSATVQRRVRMSTGTAGSTFNRTLSGSIAAKFAAVRLLNSANSFAYCAASSEARSGVNVSLNQKPMRGNGKRVEPRLQLGIVVGLKALEHGVVLLLEALRRVRDGTLRRRKRRGEHHHRQDPNEKTGQLHFAFGVRVSSLMVRPAAESWMSWSRRFWRVSSCFALVTRYVAVR